MAAKADKDAGSHRESSALWGSSLLLREVALSAKFAAAQVLVKGAEYEEAERRLEALLQEHEEAFGGDGKGPKAGLIIMKLGEVYAGTNRLTLAEGLYRNAAKLLGGDSATGLSLFDDPSGQVRCHETCVALLESKYADLLKVVPKRAAEADKVRERSQQRWKDKVSPHGSVQEASSQGLVDLQTQRLYYFS